jgi:hypothetical protein
VSIVTDLLEFAATRDEPHPIIVGKFLAQLDRQGEADLLAWLREHAARLLCAELRHINNAARSLDRVREDARAFGAAASQAEDGDATALAPFAVRYVVAPGNVRRRVADMTADDHRYVANDYTASANRSRMLAAFHVAIADRLGVGQTTADAMSETTYTALRLSILGGEAA